MICRAINSFRAQERGSCPAPMACASWGYCRERNLEAGGMANVTEADQANWRKTDNPKMPDDLRAEREGGR